MTKAKEEITGKDTATPAAKNKRIRQEAMREQLRAKGLETHVIETAKKLYNEGADLSPSHIQALKASADLRLKLINKYLPDLKATELSGPDGERIPLDMVWSIKVVE